MATSNRHELRRQAIEQTVAEIRAIEASDGVTRASVEKIKTALLGLAQQSELFPIDDFPPPPAGAERNSALYRLSEDTDHRFALYAQLSHGGTNTPVHDHTTWAVIVGLQGEENNHLFEHDGSGGISATSEILVSQGTGVAFMPEDLHSIHIQANSRVLNFHMYGLALEQLHGRQFYKGTPHEWQHFPASSGICELPEPATDRSA